MRTPAYGLSDQDIEELDAWLQRRRTGITDIVELEGFLTAIIIGPTTLIPKAWVPKVWGGKQPKFKSLEEMNRFLALVLGYYNDIVVWFEQHPDQFQPTFYESKFEGKRVVIVDEWCFGFLKGMRLDAEGWKPLKKERSELLKPIQLFGSPAGWKEIRAGDPAALHKKCGVSISTWHRLRTASSTCPRSRPHRCQPRSKRTDRSGPRGRLPRLRQHLNPIKIAPPSTLAGEGDAHFLEMRIHQVVAVL